MFVAAAKGRTMDQIAVSFGKHWFWGRLKAVRDYGEERGANSARADGTLANPGPNAA